MAHISYADPAHPEASALAARVVQERGSLPALYAMLLHSVPVTEGWLDFLTTIRQRCALPGAIRELVIIEVARLNGAHYEAELHAPVAFNEGLTAQQIRVLPSWRDSLHLFDPPQRAALAYSDAVTRDIRVAPAVFAEVYKHFDKRLIVELTATIGAYNMVTRVMEALGIAGADSIEPTA